MESCSGLIDLSYKNYIFCRQVNSSRNPAFLAIGIGLIEWAVKTKTNTNKSSLWARVSENISNYRQNSSHDLVNINQLISVLKDADYLLAVEWLESYLQNNTSSLLTQIETWVELNLTENLETISLDSESLKTLSSIFRVKICIEGYLNTEPDFQETINLCYNTHNSTWTLLYTQDFINVFSPVQPVPKTEHPDSFINFLISLLETKSLSKSSVLKLQNFYLETPDSRIKKLLVSKPVPSSCSKKCLICSEPVQNLSPFTYSCPQHPVCIQCAEPGCSLCSHKSPSASYLKSLFTT